MTSVPLASIKSLVFYKDTLTKNARRGPRVPQLTCTGKPCDLFQPDVVLCTNAGGDGTDVHWRCEADLPSQLRFGRVHVSCEGFSHKNDPNVLKGSCALEYSLVRVPKHLEENSNYLPNSLGFNDIISSIVALVISLAFLYIGYRLIKGCLDSPTRRRSPNDPRPPRPPRSSGGSGGDSYGSPPGGWPGRSDPPPPYSKSDPRSDNSAWSPGFWTGLGLGGLAGAWLRSQQQARPARQSTPPPPTRAWDWERPVASGWFGGGGGGGGFRRDREDDRGEGTSDLGTMRRSYGVGGSSSR